jgi:putative ABC transport system permease protein
MLLISIVIAVPAAYFINNLWLELLAYHVSVNLGTICLGIAVLIFFGIITVGSQTVRATFVKPVENLKSE